MVHRLYSFRSLLLTLAVALAAGACEVAGPGALDSEPLPLRPSDGLLRDPGLQAVVDLQVARDGETLAIMLTDERPDVRARAALGLASVQDPAARGALVVALSDSDADVRRDAAFALGQLGAFEAVMPLAAALESESDASVRARIYEALGKIPSPDASEALLAATPRRGEEALRTWALSVNGGVKGVVTPQMQLHVLRRLTDPDPATREGAAYFYGRIEPPAVWAANVDQLRSALEGYDPAEPAAAHLVKALGRLAEPEEVELLARWATEATDWRTRSEAMIALRPHSTEPAATAALLAGLDDPQGHVAAAAAGSLASATHVPSTVAAVEQWIGVGGREPTVVEPLLALLARQDAREFVFGWVDALDASDARGWQAGLSALGSLGGRDALTRLVVAAESPSDEVATAAVLALSNRWESDRRLPEMAQVYSGVFANALISGNAMAEFAAAQRLTDSLFLEMGSVQVLVEAYRVKLRSGEPREAAELLRLIAFVRAPEAEALLRDALDHPAAVMRVIAASGLERVTGEVVEVDRTTDSDDVRRGDAALPYDPTVIDWAYLAGLGDAPELVFETERGRVVVRMVPEEAPHTVQTMARLAEEGRFDDTPFHRVIPNFVAQGGDVEGGTGRGGPGFQITSEFNGLSYERGAIGMASAGKDTEGSQFFIAHARLAHLDGGYTVFGWVSEGMEAVDAILRGDRIVTARLVRD